MKKIALLLVVVLLTAFTLTACDSGNDAYKLYQSMSKAMEDVTSSEVHVDAAIGITAEGESVNMDMSMEMQQIVHSETDVELKMIMNMDLGDIEGVGEMGDLQATMYFKDGWLYYDMMGMQFKSQVSLEEAKQMTNADVQASLVFAQEAITNSTVTDEGDLKRISFTLNGEKLGNALDSIMGSMLDSMAIGDASLTIGDEVTYEILLGKDNLPREEHIVFNMEMDIMGEKASASYDMLMTTVGYNTVTAIDYPANLEEYTEMQL